MHMEGRSIHTLDGVEVKRADSHEEDGCVLMNAVKCYHFSVAVVLYCTWYIYSLRVQEPGQECMSALRNTHSCC